MLSLKPSATPGDMLDGPANIRWEEGTSAPTECKGHTAVWLNGLVYVGGGYESGRKESYTINCYVPVTNSWRLPINSPYCFFTMTTVNNKLVIAGGEKGVKKTNQILTFDAAQLKVYTKMITARSHATAAGHKGMLIITGGRDDKNKRLSTTELFDSKNGQWYTCSGIPQPHSSLKSVIVDNVLYLLGGSNKDGKLSTAVFTTPLDNLSSHKLKWNTHQDTPGCLSAPVSINGKQLLIVGGYKGYTRTADIYKFNTVSHSWEAIGKIPSVRDSSAAVNTDGSRVIVIGGLNAKGEATNTVWVGLCEPQHT